MPYNTKETRPEYVFKHNLKRKNQVIFLMITDGKKYHYLAVKKLSALFRSITSNHTAPAAWQNPVTRFLAILSYHYFLGYLGLENEKTL